MKPGQCWKCIVCWLFLVTCMPLQAGSAVYNISLVTDNVPDTTDARSYLDSILSSWSTDQDKAIAIWRWTRRLRRQVANLAEDGKWVFDMMHNINSYGIMNCSGASSLNATAAHLAGTWGLASPDFDGFKRELTDHTVSEIFYDNGFHLFDSSMSIFCYRHDGVVAGAQEINSNPADCPEGMPIEQYHYYYYHPAWQCATHPGPDGYRYAADNPIGHGRSLENGASSYANAVSPPSAITRGIRWGRRYILNLRPGEYYTRYWRMLMDFPPSGDYFRPAASETPDNPSQTICNLCRGNGEWFFTPPLTGREYQEVIHEAQGMAEPESGEQGPKLHPAVSASAAYVIFKISAANVITSMDIQGTARRTTEADIVRLEVSDDNGINWQPVWTGNALGEESFAIHLRQEVAGHTEVLVKVYLLAGNRNTDAGLDSISFHTITQVNRMALPALTLGTNRVQLRLGEQSESIVLWPTLHSEKYKDTAEDYFGIFCSTDSQDALYKAVLRPAANGVEGHVSWKITAPTDIVGMTVYATVCSKTVDSLVSLSTSWNGSHFQEYFRKNDPAPPADLEVVQEVDEIPAGTRQAWVKMACSRPDHTPDYFSPGLHDIVFDVRHKPRSARFSPIEVTYCWLEHRKDGDVERRHTQLVTASEQEWTINVDGYRDPTMKWVRINLKGEGPEGSDVVYGYSDGQDRGADKEKAKVRYLWSWADNVARGKGYTVSRPSCPSEPDSDGAELTNGKVVPPTGYFASVFVASSTAGWDWLGTVEESRLAVDVDLGGPQDLEGVRICTHQPNMNYNHPARVDVLLSADGTTWSSVGSVYHDDLWQPPGDYEPTEYDDHLDLAGLPAGGRQAYCFPLAFPRQSGRMVRFVFTPREGKGMGISELEVYTRMQVADWPADITLPSIQPMSLSEIRVTGSRNPFTFRVTATGGQEPYVYSWDFGDGTRLQAGATVTHSFGRPGEYPVSVVVSDSRGKMVWQEVMVSEETGRLPEDLNNDHRVTLLDSVLSQQVMTGQDPSEPIVPGADVNRDSRIGMAEAVQVLRHSSGQQDGQ